MKKFIFCCFIIAIFSCKISEKETDVTLENQASEQDSGVGYENIIVEPNQDKKKSENCLISAGYTWSDLKSDCIRVFDVGLRIEPIAKQNNNDENLAVFMVFSSDGDFVELYLPQTEKGIVLARESENQPWILDTYKLEYKNELFTLFIDGKPQFTGQGEIGSKVIKDSVEN